jgi:hypothetical protein
MSIKKLKKGLLGLAVLSSLAAGAASAQVVVYDPFNEEHQIAQEIMMGAELGVQTANAAVNTVNAGVNTASLAVLLFMKGHIKSIDGNIIDIKKSLTELRPGNMLDLTTNIYNINKNNYEINQSFKWITNNYYGDDDLICPPDALPDECEAIIGRANANLAKLIGKGTVDRYTAGYKDASSYRGAIADKSNLTDVGFAATANQKLANDALAQALSAQRGSLMAQSAGLTKLIEQGSHVQGHGNQLQYANALAGAQAVQLAEMRSLMLASENARAASAQAAADKEARQVASKQSLRRGLEAASSASAEAASSPRY